MSDGIIIALIGAAASVLSSAALVNGRINKLEKKVDEHNGYSKTIASMQTDIALIQKDIEYIKQMMQK